MLDTLLSLIAASPARPDKPFLLVPDAEPLTYGAFFALTARLAHAVRNAGVQPGDRVAVQVEKSPTALALYLACERAGAVYLPLNTAYTLSELAYFIGDAEPALVVCSPEREAGVREIAGMAAVLTLDAAGTGGTLTQAAAGAPDAFDDHPAGPDDLAAILYTSGTTGRSKGAMLSHRNLMSNARTLVELWRFTQDDVLLHALPIFHTHGLFVATNIMLAVGGSMIFLPKFDADAVFEALPRATAMMGVPTFYVRMVADTRLTREATAHMRLFVSGSAPLLAETWAAFRDKTGHEVLERYGMTETNMNTSIPYDGPRKPGLVGPPLPDVALRVVGEDGAPVPTGEIGMIEVKGPNVFGGYWRMPEKTAAEFREDGFFITGDLGTIDEAGYVQIVGRGKDLIISGGFNVYPKEIELALDAWPGVEESAVIGLPHKDFGEGVTAVVTLKAGATLDEAAVIAGLRQTLAAYKVPKRVLVVEALPRNAMGKVQKAALRERYAALYAEG